MSGCSSGGFYFFSRLRAIFRDSRKFIIAFTAGTGASATACWQYGIPVVLALLGGILVLGVAWRW
jgi:hypothetical protein